MLASVWNEERSGSFQCGGPIWQHMSCIVQILRAAITPRQEDKSKFPCHLSLLRLCFENLSDLETWCHPSAQEELLPFNKGLLWDSCNSWSLVQICCSEMMSGFSWVISWSETISQHFCHNTYVTPWENDFILQ